MYASGRLVGGASENEGRVEVFHHGTWGTVCDDNWTDREARVFCRSIGYTMGRVLAADQYEPGEGDILLDEVYCNGAEMELDDCAHNPWGESDCSHREDVGARCELEMRNANWLVDDLCVQFIDGLCKTAVTQMHSHWSYCSLVYFRQ